MKNLQLLLAIFAVHQISAQTVSLDANSIKADFTSLDNSGYSPLFQRYEVPKDSGVTSIFSSSFWITGLDAGGNICASAAIYNKGSYANGPYGDSYNSTYHQRYDRAFKITANQIFHHRVHFADAGYQPVAAITDWPGNGKASNHEANRLAPFVDVNGNGLYEPSIGDYPQICGDQAVFMIWRDDSTTVNRMPCSVSQFEYHLLAYAIHEPYTPFENTVLIHVEIFNRGLPLSQVRFSNMLDMDLGCSDNDRMGSLPGQNACYVYNDEFLGNSCDNGNACLVGTNGYNCKKITQGMTFLNHHLTSLMTFSRANQTTNPAQGEPSGCGAIANYQQSRWNDGTGVTYGGTGYGFSTTAVPWLFPGHPWDSTQWSERYPQIGPVINPGDRRMIASTFLGSFGSDSMKVIDMAYITSLSDSTTNNFPEIRQLMKDIDVVQYYYNLGAICQLGTAVIDEEIASEISIFPNPATQLIQIASPAEIDRITIRDQQGRLLRLVMPSKQTASMNVDDLQQGIYIIQIYTQKGNTSRLVALGSTF
ncbi:MAG: T9SS type A sorting domain-containing protein [Chitinophagales bacterium]